MTISRKFQVFISSTYDDLQAERQAAVSAILKAGHIPAGMELFTAGDQSQMNIIKRWIDDSDIFMLILGGRYGSIEYESRKSYTELEYEYAKSINKPLFSVVIKDDALCSRIGMHGARVQEKDHPEKLKTFREHVLQSMCGFFDDVKDIQIEVTNSLYEFGNSIGDKGWVRASDVINPKPILDEVERLTSENKALKNQLEKISPLIQQDHFEELATLLKSHSITVTPKIMAEKPELGHCTTILSVFWYIHIQLLYGIRVTPRALPFQDWLTRNIFPKLLLSGMANSLDGADGTFTTIMLSNQGKSFINWLDGIGNVKRSKFGIYD